MSITSLSDRELELQARVNRLENRNVPRGCLIVNLGDLEVALEYEFEPAERMTRDYPGSRASCQAVAVWIASTRIAPDYFDTDLVLRWEAEALQYQLERNGE